MIYEKNFIKKKDYETLFKYRKFFNWTTFSELYNNNINYLT